MAQRRPGSEAPGQATMQRDAIAQLSFEAECFGSTDFSVANSPFVVSDRGGEHIDPCWQRSEPSARGPSCAQFAVLPEYPA